jgi:hypothetical protein
MDMSEIQLLQYDDEQLRHDREEPPTSPEQQPKRGLQRTHSDISDISDLLFDELSLCEVDSDFDEQSVDDEDSCHSWNESNELAEILDCIYIEPIVK